MVSRRQVLKFIGSFAFAGTALGGYAVAAVFGERVTSYRITPPGWPKDLNVRLAILADLHVCEPWMSLKRLEAIVDQTNALEADAILMLGDYVVGHGLARYSKPVGAGVWANILGRLKAPLGVYGVLGNHDWWDEYETQLRRKGPIRAGLALEAVGIPVLENKAVRVTKDGQPFWIAGLGDQWAFWKNPKSIAAKRRNPNYFIGVDDLPGTLGQVTDSAPVILMAHEPDIFPDVPPRVSLTLSGHTHGGQVSFFGYAPVVPSRFGRRYVYGHIVEDGRHLLVSSGLGCSGLPLRFGALPEIVLVELGGDAQAT